MGGAVTLAFTFLFGTKHVWAHALVTALLAVLISFSLFLVFSLQYPFSGDVSVKPEAFQDLLRSFEERKQDQLRS